MFVEYREAQSSREDDDALKQIIMVNLAPKMSLGCAGLRSVLSEGSEASAHPECDGKFPRFDTLLLSFPVD